MLLWLKPGQLFGFEREISEAKAFKIVRNHYKRKLKGRFRSSYAFRRVSVQDLVSSRDRAVARVLVIFDASKCVLLTNYFDLCWNFLVFALGPMLF